MKRKIIGSLLSGIAILSLVSCGEYYPLESFVIDNIYDSDKPYVFNIPRTRFLKPVSGSSNSTQYMKLTAGQAFEAGLKEKNPTLVEHTFHGWTLLSFTDSRGYVLMRKDFSTDVKKERLSYLFYNMVQGESIDYPFPYFLKFINTDHDTYGNAIFNEFLTTFPDYYDSVLPGNTITQVTFKSLTFNVSFHGDDYDIRFVE